KRGEGWAWSPEIGFGPERIQFPMFKTYDSFRPQTADDVKNLKGWAEVDLEEVKTRFATYIEKAKASDPAELRKEIARVKAELSKANKPTPMIGVDPAQLKTEYDRGCGDGFAEAQRLYDSRIKDAGHRLMHLGGEMDALKRAIEIPVTPSKKFQRVDIRP